MVLGIFSFCVFCLVYRYSNYFKTEAEETKYPKLGGEKSSATCSHRIAELSNPQTYETGINSNKLVGTGVGVAVGNDVGPKNRFHVKKPKRLFF